MVQHQADIDAVLRRAVELELAAKEADKEADRASNLWLAAKLREKAANLMRQTSKDTQASSLDGPEAVAKADG